MPKRDADLHLDTDRLDFFCRTWGPTDGIPLLLLHGSFGTSRWWERLCACLPDEIYAVAPDLRGCGHSGKPPGGYTVEEQAADLVALLESLGWSDFHVMAHSSSGAIAMEYALVHGDALETMTLVDSVPVEGVFTPLDTYMLLEQMRNDRDLLRAAMATLMPALPTNEGHPQDLRFFEELVDDAQAMAPAAFTAVARGLSQWNRFADARQLTLPILLVWGDRDAIVDRDATTRTLIALPGANNLEVLRGVGHCPMVEAPQILADRWVDFITQDFAEFETQRSSVGADE